MNEFVMAMEALKAAQAVLPALIRGFVALVNWVKGPTHTLSSGIDVLNQLVGFGEEAIAQVMSLTFSNEDPVANTIGQWQSAFKTVQSRAQAAGFPVDAAAIHTALDIASHSMNFDTPLDHLTPTDAKPAPAPVTPVQ